MSLVDEPYRRWLAARLAGLRALDLEWARAETPGPWTDDELLASLHRARYYCEQLEPELRHESARWLRARNLRGWDEPLLPEGELP